MHTIGFRRFHDLPDSAVALIDGGRFFGRSPWLERLADSEPHPSRWFVLFDGPKPIAVMPTFVDTSGMHRSLTNSQSFTFEPTLAPGVDVRSSLSRLFMGVRQELGFHRLEFKKVPMERPWSDALVASLEDLGLWVRTDAEAGHRYTVVDQLSFAELEAAGPSIFKKARQKIGKLRRTGAVEMRVLRRPEDAAIAARDFDAVYRRSWKPPDPYRRFTTDLVRDTAEQGALRMFLTYLDGEPIAGRFVIRDGDAAHLFKSGYDEAYKSLSPGSILLRFCFKTLMEEGVARLNFGPGPEIYKSLWTNRVEPMASIHAFDPLTPRGQKAHAQWALRAGRRSVSRRAKPHAKKIVAGARRWAYETLDRRTTDL